jgi:hypothetical protein
MQEAVERQRLEEDIKRLEKEVERQYVNFPYNKKADLYTAVIGNERFPLDFVNSNLILDYIEDSPDATLREIINYLLVDRDFSRYEKLVKTYDIFAIFKEEMFRVVSKKSYYNITGKNKKLPKIKRSSAMNGGRRIRSKRNTRKR